MEVSESNTFLPLVHDVDPVLFEGGSDVRSGRLNRLGAHVFVVGQRRAQKALDGHWYSRALQANTDHYFRVTCGDAAATGSFRTANIALGNSYNEMFPPDPNVTGYTPVGSYAWPEFVSWTDRNESLVDPQTGILLKRVTMPQDFPITWLGDEPVTTVIDFDAKWNNADAVKIDDSASAVFAGGGTNWLLLRDDNLNLGDAATAGLIYLGRTINSVQVALKAWCSGACATEEDRKIELCLTTNGVSCSGAIREQALGTTAMQAGSVPVVVGTTTPILAFWTQSGSAPPDRTQFMVRTGGADVARNVVTWRKGSYFNPAWTAGSRIALNGKEYEIASVQSPLLLTLKSDAGMQNGVAFKGANSGVLVRKKTPSQDSIVVQYAGLKLGISHLPENWPSSGSPEMCQSAVSMDAAGNSGYRCVIQDAVPVVYWINRATGESKPLGVFTTDSKSGVDGWPGGFCAGWFSGVNPDALYCMTTDNSSSTRTILLKCQLTGKNEKNGWNPTCANVTPGSQGSDIGVQIAAFTGGQFDKSKYHCGVSGIQNERLMLVCPVSGQDSMAWLAVLDPVKGIIAAQNTWSVAPARWCAMHTAFFMGSTDWYWIAGKFFQDSGAAGQGPYVVQLSSGELSAADLMACPENPVDPRIAGTNACSSVTVDGEPRDPSPHAAETGAPGELQSAEPGDVLQADGEFMQLLAKSANTWTLRRGYGYTPATPHGPNSTLTEQCLARRFDRDTSDWSWSWDYLNDPHGANAQGTTVRREYEFDHPAGRNGVVVGMSSYLDCPWSTGCYGARTSGVFGAAPDILANGNVGFAGVAGGAVGNYAEDHASYAQVMAVNTEKKWLLDGRPFQPGPGISGTFMPVENQLYKLATTTTDGDDLLGGAQLSRLKMPTFAFCGVQPLRDTSSAATGDVIGTSAADSYKYCISRAKDECRLGARPGDIWANCPQVTSPSCTAYADQGNVTTGICVTRPSMYLSSIGQAGFASNDPKGGLGRKLTMGLSRNLLLDPYWNARALPDASWMLFRSVWLGGVRTEALLAKLPPYPERDDVDRSDFVPLTVSVAGHTVPGMDNIVIQFGYAENGDAGEYFCTSRKEACVKGAGPGYGMASDAIAGVACAGGCTLAIPAISGRAVYYRVMYRDASGSFLAASSPAVAIVP